MAERWSADRILPIRHDSDMTIFSESQTTPTAADIPLVFGLDIGTSSTKGVLVGLDGAVVARASRAHAVSRPMTGRVEMDPWIWWEELVSIAHELRIAERAVLAVGISGMGPSLVITDGDGSPLRPAILYGVDVRATEEIAELDDRYGEEAILRRTGSPLSTQSIGPKLLWLRRNEPAAFEKARLMFGTSSWLVHRLTGEYVLDRHTASQSNPLFDIGADDWAEPWATELLGAIRRPRLGWAGERAGVVSGGPAAEAGLKPGTPVVFGTIDAWAESASVGALEVGTLSVMYGTTMFFATTSTDRASSSALWGDVGIMPGTHHLSGSLSSAGSMMQWVREFTGGASHDELTAAAQASGAGARGLLMLPYLAGERTPISDPSARGVLTGIRLDHRPGDLYRAALESTAYAARHNIDAMRAAGARVERAVSVGGGSVSRLWLQIVSDVCGIDQTLPTVTIGASYGMAFLAASLEHEVSISSWNPPATVVTAQTEHASVYEAHYRSYLSLYPATAAIVHRLV